nr:hypothetical protein [Aquisalinus luteolus]
MRFQKSGDLSGGFKPTGRKSFNGFPDDRCSGPVRDKHFSVAGNFLVAVAPDFVSAVISCRRSRFHLLERLPGILLTLKLTLSGKYCLDKLTFWSVIKAEIQALDGCFTHRERLSQIEVEDRIPRESFQIIEHDYIISVRIGIEKRQKRHHARTGHKVAAARRIIGKHCLDFISFIAAVCAAALFLCLQPRSHDRLFDRRNPAINQCLGDF